MKNRTSTILGKICNSPCFLTAIVLLGCYTVATEVSATDTFQDSAFSCSAGFADTWIITEACDLGGSTNIKVDDGIDIRCDSATNRWSVDFYEEPLNTNSGGDSSDAVRYPVCPGNGYLETNEQGSLVMLCSFWEAQDNLTKQLVFEMLPSIKNGDVEVRSMQWKAYELDNPNVICGVSGRPEGGDGGVAGSTRQVDSD